MAKVLFTPNEIQVSGAKVVLADPMQYFDNLDEMPQPEEKESEVVVPEIVETYTGPTAEDLRKEAEEFKAQWEKEQETMIQAARTEAERIIQEAEDAGKSKVEEHTQSAESIRQNAQAEADKLIDDAKKKASGITGDAKKAVKKETDEAKEKGRVEGKEEGYKEGKDEANRILERFRTVLEKTQDKRTAILQNSEQEVIDLVLLIARKVVKVISEEEEGIVVENVRAALGKVQSEGKITIKVNTADLELTTSRTKEFIAMLESIKDVEVQEDSTIGRGGCIVETDFGEIDARITSQLAELEDKIRSIQPIKKRKV
ncbi:MAG: flagellar assembly protein FliH [Spirochaetaceae bacterium]|nr:flagellar assembly protein FliH [Spirochaetaceae bacterium]